MFYERESNDNLKNNMLFIYYKFLLKVVRKDKKHALFNIKFIHHLI